MNSMKGRKLKFAITDYGFPNVESERQVIENAGGDLFAFQCRTAEDVIDAARDADALLVQWAPITRSVIQRLRRCKVIVRYGIGVDNIDLDAARDCGIPVCNVPDYCVDEVADHTVALAMALLRQLPLTDRLVREGVWKITPPRPIAASRHMVFATVGYGRIARAVLERARAFKFQLAAFDPYLAGVQAGPKDIVFLGRDEILSQADILSLHAPLTAETRHIIDVEALSKMKSTAIVINSARGGLIDTMALAGSLSQGGIAAAGLDVFETEPLLQNHPLRLCTNALLTSHTAWYSELSLPTLQKMVAEEAVRALTGKELRSRVT
jgi:D-3-phosphoglycerate dehydrogenase / 2-oxoglutarate reductase